METTEIKKTNEMTPITGRMTRIFPFSFFNSNTLIAIYIHTENQLTLDISIEI